MNSAGVELFVWGKHAVEDALLSKVARVLELRFSGKSPGEHQSLLNLSEKKAGRPKMVSPQELTRWVNNDKHQNIGARVEIQTIGSSKEWFEARPATQAPTSIMVLDGVQDPQNLGSVYRSAHFFGASAVVITKDRSASLTGVVAKASAGGLFSIPTVRITNLARELTHLAGLDFWRIGLAADASKPLHSMDLQKRNFAFVLGSEGEGMRRLTQEQCDELAVLPGVGKRDSLNVGVSAAIALYEWRRQQPTLVYK